MKLTISDVERVKALAGEATRGPWERVSHNWSDTSIYARGHGAIATLSIADDADEETAEKLARVMDSDAAYIAAAHPEVVAQLAEAWLVLRDAMAALREAEAILGGEYGDHYGVLCNRMLALEERARDLIGGE